MEGGRWQVTLAGYQGYYPPEDHEGWMAYAQRLEHPLLAQLVRSAEPIGPIRIQRYPRQRRWMFHSLKRLPQRYGMLGDAVCSFDPLFGQALNDRTFRQSRHDREVYGAFLEVMRLDASPARLIRPDTLLRILKPVPALPAP